MLARKYHFVSKYLRFKSFTYVLKLKTPDYLELTSFIINDVNASLLNNIINKSYVQVIVVQRKLFLEELLWAINKNQ